MTNIRNMVGAGLALATVYSLFVLAMYALQGSEPFDSNGVSLWAIVAAYYTGGITGGAIVGIAWPLLRWRVGAILVGIVAGLAICMGVGTAGQGLPWTWSDDDWFGVIFAAVALGGLCGNYVWGRGRRM